MHRIAHPTVRTKARYEYSFIESAAVKIGSDIFEVSSFGEYSLNGVTSAKLPDDMAGLYPIIYEQVNKKKSKFTIHLDGDEKIAISVFKDWVNVKVENATAHSFGFSAGLMGNYYTGEMLGRDGRVIEDPNDFGLEWQVQPSDPQLFRATRAPQFPQKCILPDKKAKEARRLGEGITEEEAAKACGHLTGPAFDACVYDVTATNDLDMADAGAF